MICKYIQIFESTANSPGPLDNLARMDNDATISIDYRLSTFQDIARYSENNPGAYFDFSKCGWFCRICQSFSVTKGRPWVGKAVNLGDHPARIFKRHFESRNHRECVKKQKLLEKPSVHRLIIEGSLEAKERSIKENRDYIKSLFLIVKYQVSNNLANDKFESLINLIAMAGSDQIKKYIQNSGKNATYRSDATFQNVLTVLNRYLENKVLEKVRTSHFTLFHDETTDISNSSQANVYVMIPHEEHYFGLINMKI